MIQFSEIPCPLCGSDTRTVLGRPRKIDALFSSLGSDAVSNARVVSCGNCSLIYLHPFPHFSDSLLKKMYSNDNDYFLELNPSMEKIIHVVNPMRRFSKAQQFIKRKIRNYLEIGCGEGYGLLSAQKFGWNVYGQDISPDFAEIAKRKTGLSILVGQLDENSFEKNFFDLVYIDSVLEHVPDPLRYMKCVINFLSPGGIIYLTLPNEDSLQAKLLDLALKITGSDTTCRIAPFVEPYHVIGFSKSSIQFLATSLGLEMPYCIRHFSYGHLERNKRPGSFARFIKRSAFGLLHLACDAVDKGMNMEAILVASKNR